MSVIEVNNLTKDYGFGRGVFVFRLRKKTCLYKILYQIFHLKETPNFLWVLFFAQQPLSSHNKNFVLHMIFTKNYKFYLWAI